MSYPPQQPGQSSYQGLGAYSGGPPKKKRTGMIVAIVAIVVLALGGGGVAVYFLTKDGDGGGNSASSSEKTSERSNEDDSSGGTRDDDASNKDDSDDSGGRNSPEGVRDAYIDAYEKKDFKDVVNSSCRAYKQKFGTDTTKLETTLEDYDITATADGEPEVKGKTASAKINLELTAAGTTERPKIRIKILEEDGQWRFCGEGKA